MFPNIIRHSSRSNSELDKSSRNTPPTVHDHLSRVLPGSRDRAPIGHYGSSEPSPGLSGLGEKLSHNHAFFKLDEVLYCLLASEPASVPFKGSGSHLMSHSTGNAAWALSHISLHLWGQSRWLMGRLPAGYNPQDLRILQLCHKNRTPVESNQYTPYRCSLTQVPSPRVLPCVGIWPHPFLPREGT